MPPSEVCINVHCHCRTTSFSLRLPKSKFPLKSALCHCKSCRHATGQLFATFAVIPMPFPAEIEGAASENLAEYWSSPTLSRLFCRKCGASIANVDRADDQEEWELATGSIEFVDDSKRHEGKLNRVQLWIEDINGDGGAATWVNKGALAGMDRHWKGRGSGSVSDHEVKKLTETSCRNVDRRLSVRCHCGNISFDISRPEKNFNNGSGFEITSWATVPQKLINTTSPDLDTYLADSSKLTHYESSSDVSRYFCLICGATIFYQKHGLDTIDIGIGVLDPGISEEARVEGWLSWQKYPRGLAYQEDAVDKNFVSNLAEGLRLHKGEEGQ